MPVYSDEDIKKNRTTGLTRMNQGGTMTRGGVVTAVGPSAADKSTGGFGTGLTKAAPGAGSMTRGGVTVTVPPGGRAINPTAPGASVPAPQPALAPALPPALPPSQPAAIQPALNTPGMPVKSPTTAAASQTEGANPLTGDGNAQAGGTTDIVKPAQALGFAQRGAGTPPGQDAASGKDPNMGGTGLYAKKFSNPKSASLYDQYIKKLFGSADN